MVYRKIPNKERKIKFIARALSLAKYTDMREIAKRAGVSPRTVRLTNLKLKIRDKKAISVGATQLSGKQFDGIVNSLIMRPEMTFVEISRLWKVWKSTVVGINKRLQIQDEGQIMDRTREILTEKGRKPRKPRICLFTPQEKWEIIQKNAPLIINIVSKFKNSTKIRIPMDDLVQEIKITAFNALDILTTKEKGGSYIGGIARITILDYIRKEAKKLGIDPEKLEKITTRKKVRGK